MRFQTAAARVIVAVALLAPWGCGRFRKAPKAPAPPAPKLELPPPLKPEPAPIEEPNVPERRQPPEGVEQPVLPPAVEQLPPPPKPAPRRRPAKPQPVQPVKPEPAPEPAPLPPEPQLGEVIPGELAKRHEQSLAESLAAARAALDSLRGKRLTREQADMASRVKAFIRQAGQAQRTDVAAAAELARRAALLARELKRSLN